MNLIKSLKLLIRGFTSGTVSAAVSSRPSGALLDVCLRLGLLIRQGSEKYGYGFVQFVNLSELNLEDGVSTFQYSFSPLVKRNVGFHHSGERRNGTSLELKSRCFRLSPGSMYRIEMYKAGDEFAGREDLVLLPVPHTFTGSSGPGFHYGIACVSLCWCLRSERSFMFFPRLYH
ncbi:hypothetical protein CEXT_439791 [Caerostris extrusa]|uniref:Uncharacterized protein n=1 Tax=Caerostris extrusa TaxID=172846 RepID=A0AAV4Y107_CAEEX|nr:hypothetical protein CEXT_439791 [Caerostris extrusa]